ncbi:MAG: hypothetical protein HUU21_16095 [Polyangiaceae bacterium]|nr:hypothetical protein [Polyangiaceae bacterium]NUQ75072.1 hypothetical protein [Polyangiaceae bacterium]
MAIWKRLGALALVMMGLPGIGCATSIETDGGGGSSDGDGGDGAGGSGGAGGAPVSPCPVDCSTIQAPPCYSGTCNTTTLQCEIVPSPKGTLCEDGLFCTVGETCEEGTCAGGYENTCGMNPDSCSIVTCNEATKACSTKPGPDGTACVLEGDLCLVNTVCKAGVCVGAQKDCFFAPGIDECHVGVCNPTTGACEPVPGNDGAACPNSGDLCMVNKTCTGGICQGGFPKNCSALTNGCNIGTCDPVDGSCFQQAIPPGGMCAEATDECNTGYCDMNGACIASPNPGVACASATDTCNNGFCDANGSCVPTPTNDGGSCEDGNSCTLGETCSAGACTGGMMGNYVVYFSESFASNAAGWTFPPGQGIANEWSIGPAMASSGGFPVGNEDPAMDHTPTQDNGIAGVAIGGYATEVIHPQHYIESPAINTDVMGPVYLEFWRWLNSDYTPYMQNTVDVWNGASWINIWSSGPSPAVQDAAWNHVSYDITAHKNAAMKIRFGFDIQSSGVFTVSSWNIDDVVVGNAVCN